MQRFTRPHRSVEPTRFSRMKPNTNTIDEGPLFGGDSLPLKSPHLYSCPWARQNGAVLGDFDVLSLCDTGAQWYCDVAEREQLQLESKLRETLGPKAEGGFGSGPGLRTGGAWRLFGEEGLERSTWLVMRHALCDPRV